MMRLSLHYYELVWFKVLSNLKSDSSRSYLSYAWWIIEPVLHMIAYYFVFSFLLRGGGEDFVAFLLVGITSWLWFNRSIANASNSIIAGRGLFLQVDIRKDFFPTVAVMFDAIKQLNVFLLLFIFLLVYGISPSILWLYFPLLYVVQFALIMSIALITAAIIPYIPDLRFVISNGLQLLMFSSGIFYSYEIIPEDKQWIFFLNPMAVLIKEYRNIILYGREPELATLIMIFVCSAVIIYMMMVFLKKYNHEYARLAFE